MNDTEVQLREKIAKEIEGWTVTIATLEGGIKVHPPCWKCGTEPLTQSCIDQRTHEMKSAFKFAAKIARGRE